jgi:hypothetical protein
MCEYIDKETTPVKGFVASEDIVCYKILKKVTNFKRVASYYSSVRGKQWYIGETCESPLTLVTRGDLYECWYYSFLVPGWHRSRVYASEKNIGLWCPVAMFTPAECLETEQGFYSYSRFMSERMEKDALYFAKREYTIAPPYKIVIGRFSIPKGSRYYVNEDASVYISDKIRFEGVVCRYTDDGEIRQITENIGLCANI